MINNERLMANGLIVDELTQIDKNINYWWLLSCNDVF